MVDDGFVSLFDGVSTAGYGGFFGNGLAGFSALPFTVEVDPDEGGRPCGLRIDDDPVGDTDRWGFVASCRWRDIRAAGL